MSFTYGFGYGLSSLRKAGETGPPVVRMTLTLSANNWLYPEDIENAAEWFVEDDFVFQKASGNVDFLWVDNHWEAQGDFTTTSGNGTIVQGANSTAGRYVNASLPGGNILLAAAGVRLTGAGGVLISWSGV